MNPTLPERTRLFRPDSAGIDAASEILRGGGLLALPTETVYGLAADARNGQAVAAIYAAKNRPSFNPLIVHLPDLDSARQIADFPPEALDLARAFWPGALTIVVPLRPDSGIASIVTAGLDTVAIRVPAHPVAQQLLRQSGLALAAPSANLSGRISPTTASHVLDSLGGRIDGVLDGGRCPVGLESTIIGWRDGRATLLRPGGLPTEAITPLTGELATLGERATPNAPGQLSSHYAPKASLRLNAAAALPGETHIGFGPDGGALNLSPTGDLTEAAANLFDMLHRADATGQPIAVAPVPDHGLGRAINDRLRRAAAPR